MANWQVLRNDESTDTLYLQCRKKHIVSAKFSENFVVEETYFCYCKQCDYNYKLDGRQCLKNELS